MEQAEAQDGCQPVMKLKLLKLTNNFTIASGVTGSCWTAKKAKMAVFGPIGAMGTKMPFWGLLNPL